MARVTQFERVAMDRNVIHAPVACSYSTFTDTNGERYIQLDTYGSKSRKIIGKKSQSIQLDRAGAKLLIELLQREGFA